MADPSIGAKFLQYSIVDRVERPGTHRLRPAEEEGRRKRGSEETSNEVVIYVPSSCRGTKGANAGRKGAGLVGSQRLAVMCVVRHWLGK